MTVSVERTEEAKRLVNRQLLVELRLLQRDADALAQLTRILLPCQAEDLDVAAVGRCEAFENLDRRRLAGAVRPKQTEALAAPHRQIQTINGFHVGVVLPEVATRDRETVA